MFSSSIKVILYTVNYVTGNLFLNQYPRAPFCNFNASNNQNYVDLGFSMKNSILTINLCPYHFHPHIENHGIFPVSNIVPLSFFYVLHPLN